MKLTVEQITVIEKKLVINGLNFDDLKLEVTDHIASEIEELIDTNTLSFEENLKLVFSKWSFQFKPSSSFWVGIIYSAPKIVMKKWESTLIRQQLLSLFIAIIPAIILFELYKIYNKPVVIGNVIQRLSLLFFILIVYNRVLIWKSKRKTSFSLMFDTNSNLILVWLILFGIGKAQLRMNLDTIFGCFLLLWFFTYLVFNLQLAYKHFQFEKKLTISNS